MTVSENAILSTRINSQMSVAGEWTVTEKSVLDRRSGRLLVKGGSASAPGVRIKWQNGPRKKRDGSLKAPNGAFVEDLLWIVRSRLEIMNESFPHRTNEQAIGAISDAIGLLDERRKDRRERGVEGENKD